MAASTDERGWQVGKSLTDCLQHMLENEVACDVIFEIQSAGNPNVRVSAHKMILQARSPVFEAMFSGAFVEVDQDVTIRDIDSDAFKAMLRYMYTDEVTLTGDNVLHLLNAANKYILEGLSQQCKEFLSKQISVDNVCSILTHSLVYQDEDLVNTCMDLIAPNAKAVSQTEAFYDMSHDALLKVVRCDNIPLGVEADLFEGCIKWGEHRIDETDQSRDQKIRELLGECLHKIRFSFIPPDEFAKKFAKTNVLTGEEKSLILCMGLNRDESYNADLESRGFDITSRLVRFPRYARSYGIAYRVQTANTATEAFTISANKSIILVGFSVYGGVNGSEHNVRITVQNTTKEGDEYTCESKITSGEVQPIPIYIRKMKIDPDTEHKVSISLTGPNSVGYGHEMKNSWTSASLQLKSTQLNYPFSEYDRARRTQLYGGFVAEIIFQYVQYV